ncbi:hypothetical protein QJS04_geneDACA005696 [Acorus gramineus]|uniref:Uncharacterized protein n=1 Tax=Acorus gramineus TaxID=55184 RepID=A0AAV9BE33_ACOGR|nr:hypothetical protein QJS04_geneDACA005696 [Acorus gramineus]
MDEAKPTFMLPKPVLNAPVTFDPSRMIGIIERKALIKHLADAYYAECLTSHQELLSLQRKWEEMNNERLLMEDTREMMRQPKCPNKNSYSSPQKNSYRNLSPCK